jgi:sterol desaturase/sphingolipid hydroxylase (fatty acid hydroxylase superfamily)
LFLVTFAVTMFLYYIGYEGTHFLMHKPSVPWIERSRAFQFIKRHHRIHHVRMNRNLNVFIPLADLVLGTLVRTMPSPAPTPASARQLARRHSRYGQSLRSGDPQPERPAPVVRKEDSVGGS